MKRLRRLSQEAEAATEAYQDAVKDLNDMVQQISTPKRKLN